MLPRKPQSEYPQKFINPHRLFYGVWLPHWLEGRREVSEKAKKLYAHLTYFAGDKGYAWPTLNTLSEKLHVSRRHVIRLVKELIHHGLISVTNVNRPGKGSCANHYHFLWHPWMQEEPGNLDSSRASPVVSPSDKNVTPPGDIDVAPPGDMRVTPGVTPMSPKENNKKRLNKKSPKGAFGNSVPLQGAALPSDSRHPAVENAQPPSATPGPHSAREPEDSIHSEDSRSSRERSRPSEAITRKGWSITRRLLAEFWENCKVRPNHGILSGYAIRSLQSGFRETDVISAFERALHQCHGHATDAGETWEASSTVHRAEALLEGSQKRWKPLTTDERAELRARIKLSLAGTPIGKEPEESIPSPQSAPSVRNPELARWPAVASRKKENRPEPIPPGQWPSPRQVRATFNALRRAAGLPTRPEMPG